MEKSFSDKLIEILMDNGVPFKEDSSGHELIFSKCYSCGREKKLYAQKETGLFKCFRCEETGNAIKLIAKYLNISFKEASNMLNERVIEDVSIEKMKKDILESTNTGLILNLSKYNKNSIKSELKLPEPIKLSDDYVLLEEGSNLSAYNYLISRGYTPAIIKDLKLYVLPFQNYKDAEKILTKKYKTKDFENLPEEEKNLINLKIKNLLLNQGRILFPLYIEGEIYGYVARDYTGKKMPKVLNSTGNFRSFYFWNFDLVKNSDEIILCEGTTSAVKSGIHRSIALLGKFATRGQIKLLKKTKAKKIYLCLDIGTESEQEKIIEELTLFFQIYKINLPPVIKIKEEITEEIITILKDLKIQWSISNQLMKIEDTDRKKLVLKFNDIIKKYKLFKDNEDLLWKIAKESEYLDSGDYSFEEMEEFKKNASLIN